MNNHSRLVFLLGILISVVSLWITLTYVDIHEIYTLLVHSHGLMAIPLIVAFSLYYWIKAIRWQQLLQPIADTKTSAIFTPMMIGFLGNNILPARLGEFIRMYLGAKLLKLNNSQIFATIIMERVFDILTIVFYLGIAILLENDIPPLLLSAGYLATFLGFGLLLCIVVYVRWTQFSLVLIKKCLFFLPSGFTKSVTHHLEIGSRGLHAIRDSKLTIKIISTSLAQWGCMGITIYFSLMAVDISTPLSAAFIVLAFTVFAVIIPAAPGFFGTIQLAYILALRPYDIPESDAFAASVFFHVITYFSVLFVGFYLLHRLGYTMKQLRLETESTTQP